MDNNKLLEEIRISNLLKAMDMKHTVELDDKSKELLEYVINEEVSALRWGAVLDHSANLKRRKD